MTYQKLALNLRDAQSQQFLYETPWDAQKIQSCVCDDGFMNYDCGLRDCPHGDDPLTTGQVNEIQLLKCTATSGYFVLFYKGLPSGDIPTTASASAVKAALLLIPTIRDITVTFSLSTSTVCNSVTGKVNIVSIEFTQNFGPQPPLVPFTQYLVPGATALSIVTSGKTLTDSFNKIYTSVVGTKENDVCSNRGICDTASGSCDCFTTNSDIFLTSNGYGGPGARGDCGYPYTVTGSCPGEIACNLNGYCSTGFPNPYRCTCSAGWKSGDCSERICPYGKSWFSYPTAANTGHNIVTECSDMGLCDRTSGICNCRTNFFGAACENMICGGGTTNPCSGNGQCLTMAEIATKATTNGVLTPTLYGTDPNNGQTWDANRVYTCLCDEGFEGYDCSLRSCPRGDNPATYNDKREIQVLRCIAVSGTFTLTFREHTTDSISFNANISTIESELNMLPSINKVFVHYTTGEKFCTPGPDLTTANYVEVRFMSPTGDLPAISFDASGLVAPVLDPKYQYAIGITIATDGTTLGGYASVRGTTENEICSQHGLCDYVTGTCQCMPGWASSNGYGGPGQLGDCGMRIGVPGYHTFS